MKMIKGLIAGAALLGASNAMAVTIGGVTWDESYTGLDADFTGISSFIQNLVAGTGQTTGTTLEGYGNVATLNGASNFCTYCQELNYTFTGFTVAAVDGFGRPTGFSGGSIDLYTDSDVGQPTSIADASNGTLWLSLAAVTDPLSGFTLNVTYGGNTVYASTGLDVVTGVGIADYNFDTNTKLIGDVFGLVGTDNTDVTVVDFIYDSSITQGETSGSSTLKGDSIPVPAPLALLGLGLVGLGLRNRKTA